ncbi:MAG: DUF2807 domain-containing protein [Paludibacter sp.]|nr:DUF2807 domain-containing protein [Bacteroidales bacterium]MCM1069334.1 DUF2807 domain-containing protein [Prevotella sp.]MCM1353854.1 DUF2807 domain-containing protein [Bacteroides sp.]MCM1442896.1 DUF2807 domain-containing protein [Muribaculum sp.]MCM1481941.1 DUF2807 domain-containing protein [Paludibacter sp.]
MKHTSLLLCLVAILNTSCNKISITYAGINETQVIGISDTYREISVSHGIDAEFSPEITEAQVISDKNLMPYITTSVRNGKLTIQYNKQLFLHGHTAQSDFVTLVKLPYQPNLTEINLANSSTLYIKGNLPSLDIKLQNGSTLYIDGDCTDIEAELHNGSQLYPNGKFLTAELKLHNGSIIGDGTYSMIVKDVEADFYNGSMMRCTADNAIFRGSMHNGSILRYRGIATFDIDLYNDSKILQD